MIAILSVLPWATAGAIFVIALALQIAARRFVYWRDFIRGRNPLVDPRVGDRVRFWNGADVRLLEVKLQPLGHTTVTWKTCNAQVSSELEHYRGLAYKGRVLEKAS